MFVYKLDNVSAVTNNLIKTFCAQHGTDIIAAITDTGLFFSAVVAQLSVESQNGASGLAANYNNYGGIKGTSSNGVALDTTEGNSKTASVAYFKTYTDFPSFMTDYVAILTGSRYTDALSATSPQDQVTAWVNAGYSTMTAANYLASGIQDRINACRSLFPGLSRVQSAASIAVENVNTMFQTSPTLSDDSSNDN